MKKSFTLIILCLVVAVSATAQRQKLKKTDFAFIANAKTIDVVFDYSKAHIAGFTLDEFFEKKSYEETEGTAWKDYFMNKFVPKLRLFFIHAANEELGTAPFRLAHSTKSNYVMQVSFTDVDDDGESDATITITYMDKSVTFEANGEGGVFGSLENLMGDATKDMGESVGEYLSKMVLW